MPNKFCRFGCNKTKKLSVFITPKNQSLKEKWLNALNIDHLGTNEVICEEHFPVDAIKKQCDILNKEGNIVCSAKLLRPHLKPNAVPFSASKQLKFSEKKVEHLIQPCNISDINSTTTIKTLLTCDSNEKELIYEPTMNIELLRNDLTPSSRIMLEHNYSASFDDNTSLISTSVFNMPVYQKNELNQTSKLQVSTASILFNELIAWDLNLPSHWKTYSSIDKKFFGVSEIVFAQKQNIINSFMRKTIIINQDLEITCNILGKNVSRDKLTNSFHKLESRQNLIDLIDEIASMQICRGVDLSYEKKYDSMFSRNNSLTVDTMLTKRHLNCPITIINSYYCSFCAREKQSINRQGAQRFSIFSQKRSIIKTTPKSKKSLDILRKNNELQRKQNNRFGNTQ